jgi:type 2A phosphatase activator TIP41
MPHCFFILYRHFLRVDNVLFRLFDVRVFHSFGSDEVIQEVNGMEGRYDAVKSVSSMQLGFTVLILQMLESQQDLSPLTDAAFVQRALSHLPPVEQSGKPWPGLGKSVSVLKIPRDGLVSSVDNLRLS